MTPAAFAARVVGVPWKRWHSGWGGLDCWGLVVLYFREVRGVDLGAVPRTDIGHGFDALGRHWPRCEPEPGACAFMAWHDGAPAHCGILLTAAHVLHAPGSEDKPGSARVTPLDVMRRIYGEITFHRHDPC